MGQLHFEARGLGSFFGRLVCQRIVSRDHFLVKLNQVIDWEAFVAPLLLAYQGLAEEGVAKNESYSTPSSPAGFVTAIGLCYNPNVATLY